MLGRSFPASAMGASESSELFLIDSGISTQHTFLAPYINCIPWSLKVLVVDTIFVWTWNLGTENVVGFCSLFSQQVLHEDHSLSGSRIYSTVGSNAPGTAGGTDPHPCGAEHSHYW